jgi:hypothetical protein
VGTPLALVGPRQRTRHRASVRRGPQHLRLLLGKRSCVPGPRGAVGGIRTGTVPRQSHLQASRCRRAQSMEARMSTTVRWAGTSTEAGEGGPQRRRSSKWLAPPPWRPWLCSPVWSRCVRRGHSGWRHLTVVPLDLAGARGQRGVPLWDQRRRLVRDDRREPECLGDECGRDAGRPVRVHGERFDRHRERHRRARHGNPYRRHHARSGHTIRDIPAGHRHQPERPVRLREPRAQAR